MRTFRALFLLVISSSLMAQFHLPGTGGGSAPPKPAKQPSKQSTPVPNTPTATPTQQNAEPAGAFDYYVLSLSWAPNFCATPANASANPQECAAGKSINFAVHGLWPETNTGTSPENCGGSKSVPGGLVKSMLPYMYSSSLVQHEWTTHGTCSGLSQTAFFTDVLQARTSVQIPVQFTSLDAATAESPAQIEAQFAAANTGFPEGAFRTDCKSGSLAEVRICFDKTLKPQECTASAGECSDGTIRILPVR